MQKTHTYITHPIDWCQLYQYTSDLLCLEFCRPDHPRTTPDPLTHVSTTLSTKAWVKALAAHPDRAFAQYVTSGLQTGFRIDFNYPSPLRSATANMPSAAHHPQVMNDYMAKELSLGRFLGPFSSFPAGQVSRVWVIPKGHNTGKWRLITDLLFPEGASVNDGIDPILCSL